MIQTTATYMDQLSKDIAKIGEGKNDENEKEISALINMCNHNMARLLDIIHKSMPGAYALFPDQHQYFDNLHRLMGSFVFANLMRKCNCDYCKEHPLQEAPIDPAESVTNKEETQP